MDRRLKTKVNHTNKRTFSSETNDVKNNCSVSKKSKKDIPPIPLNESVVETTDQPSLELTTPTFNLISQFKSHSVGRKMKVDVSNPIYKLPFNHGWKRELVYRTTGAAIRIGDVYYYCPNNHKLRSFKEIEKYLVQYNMNDNRLSKVNFTFANRPIGINDKSKEITRDAKNKLSKDHPFYIAVKHKKPKTPILPRSANKQTESDQDKSKLEAINTFSSTPEILTEDSHLSSPLKTDIVEANTSIVQRRLSTSDREIIMQAPCGIHCAYSNEPGTLKCTQCLVNYHPECVGLNANPSIEGYVCTYCQNSSCLQEPSNNVVVDTPEPSLITCDFQEPKYLEENLETSSSLKDKIPDLMAYMQSDTNMVKSITVNCDYLVKDSAKLLSRFENLESLRLENCSGKFDIFAQDIFYAIKNLKKLRNLELININFTSTVKDELGKCYGINALLIIPAYDCQTAIINCNILDCLKILSKTLTHVVWGLTKELLCVTDSFISGHQEYQHTTGDKLHLGDIKEHCNNIPVLIKRKSKPGEEASLQEKVDNVHIMSVTDIKKIVETMMIKAKTKIIKVEFNSILRVYLAGQFNDL